MQNGSKIFELLDSLITSLEEDIESEKENVITYALPQDRYHQSVGKVTALRNTLEELKHQIKVHFPEYYT